MQASLGKTLEVVENLLTQLDAEEALYSPDMSRHAGLKSLIVTSN